MKKIGKVLGIGFVVGGVVGEGFSALDMHPEPDGVRQCGAVIRRRAAYAVHPELVSARLYGEVRRVAHAALQERDALRDELAALKKALANAEGIDGTPRAGDGALVEREGVSRGVVPLRGEGTRAGAPRAGEGRDCGEVLACATPCYRRPVAASAFSSPSGIWSFITRAVAAAPAVSGRVEEVGESTPPIASSASLGGSPEGTPERSPATTQVEEGEWCVIDGQE